MLTCMYDSFDGFKNVGHNGRSPARDARRPRRARSRSDVFRSPDDFIENSVKLQIIDLARRPQG